MAHTQAPWKIIGHTEIRAGARIVAEVGYYDSENAPDSYKAETRANARLISAAPDLASALRDLLSAGDAYEFRKASDAARAALEKAGI